MAVTVTQVAGALRIGDGRLAPPEPIAGTLTRLLAVSQATVERRAPDAPEDVRDEAAIRMCGYLFDAPEAAGGDRYASAFRNSGAYALVSAWAARRAGAI